MKLRSVVLGILSICLTSILEGQAPQGFFLNSWQPIVISNPEFIDLQQTSDPYESIKANSSLITNEVRIKTPPLSVTFVLVESGNKELLINENIVGVNDIPAPDKTLISPNPTNGQFLIINIPEGTDKIEILSISGMIIYTDAISGNTYSRNPTKITLAPGLYFVNLKGKGISLIKKLIVN